ncbi:hypothetical protein D3C78_1404600 [compost metagenome]
MRSMVSYNDVDRSVLQSLNTRFNIPFGSQRRVHFPVCVKSRNILLRQNQVMRTNLCSYVNSDFLSLTNQADRLLCTDMAYMVVNPGCLSQQNIAAYMNRFGLIRNPFETMTFGKFAFCYRRTLYERVVLAVCDYRPIH